MPTANTRDPSPQQDPYSQRQTSDSFLGAKSANSQVFEQALRPTSNALSHRSSRRTGFKNVQTSVTQRAPTNEEETNDGLLIHKNEPNQR